jgi:hypothetical protein
MIFGFEICSGRSRRTGKEIKRDQEKKFLDAQKLSGKKMSNVYIRTWMRRAAASTYKQG